MQDKEVFESLISALRAARTMYPTERVGQLIVNAIMLAGWPTADAFHVHDDYLRDALIKRVAR